MEGQYLSAAFDTTNNFCFQNDFLESGPLSRQTAVQVNFSFNQHKGVTYMRLYFKI